MWGWCREEVGAFRAGVDKWFVGVPAERGTERASGLAAAGGEHHANITRLRGCASRLECLLIWQINEEEFLG